MFFYPLFFLPECILTWCCSQKGCLLLESLLTNYSCFNFLVSLHDASTSAGFQVTQTMQIPLSYAEDIIGVGGGNIAYIRRTSGAVLTVQESRGIADEITVEIKGSASQVQMAQQLIQVIHIFILPSHIPV